MTYSNIVEGRFIKRLNRFLAEVEIDGQVHKVHVKNTGRCRELFIEGVQVFLEESDNPNRKTRYSLINVFKGDMLVNIDSQVPNQVMFEALMDGKIDEIPDVTYARREKTYGDSRFDIYYETSDAKGFIEVKGVTLEVDGLAMFPDAPTERGSKHILELKAGQTEGYKNYVCFLIQMDGVRTFRPHYERDLALAENLYDAVDNGVGVLIYDSVVSRDGIELGQRGQLLSREEVMPNER